MKKNITILFTGDIASAIFAVIIFGCVSFMTVAHFINGTRGMGLFLELCLVACAWGLIKAVYKENKKTYILKNHKGK